MEHAEYCLAPGADIQLRRWDEHAVLYHGAAASTYEISAILASSLDILMQGPHSLESLSRKISAVIEGLSQEECQSHLQDGYQQLMNNGIIQQVAR